MEERQEDGQEVLELLLDGESHRGRRHRDVFEQVVTRGVMVGVGDVEIGEGGGYRVQEGGGGRGGPKEHGRDLVGHIALPEQPELPPREVAVGIRRRRGVARDLPEPVAQGYGGPEEDLLGRRDRRRGIHACSQVHKLRDREARGADLPHEGRETLGVLDVRGVEGIDADQRAERAEVGEGEPERSRQERVAVELRQSIDGEQAAPGHALLRQDQRVEIGCAEAERRPQGRSVRVDRRRGRTPRKDERRVDRLVHRGVLEQSGIERVGPVGADGPPEGQHLVDGETVGRAKRLPLRQREEKPVVETTGPERGDGLVDLPRRPADRAHQAYEAVNAVGVVGRQRPIERRVVEIAEIRRVVELDGQEKILVDESCRQDVDEVLVGEPRLLQEDGYPLERGLYRQHLRKRGRGQPRAGHSPEVPGLDRVHDDLPRVEGEHPLRVVLRALADAHEYALGGGRVAVAPGHPGATVDRIDTVGGGMTVLH